MTRPRAVTCPNCGTWVAETGRAARCPTCGVSLDVRPPSRPDLEAPHSLQGPAFEAQREDDSTAPMSEFVAAGAVVGGVIVLVAGALMSSGAVALAGAVLILVVMAFFSIFKGAFGRAMQHYRAVLWTGRHPDEAAARDRERHEERDG